MSVQAKDEVRVLVVEDEPLISMMAEEMLEELGYVVAASVSSVEDALVAVGDRRPDAVLLDVNLSGHLSYEVAHHCSIRGVPVVLTTGYDKTALPDGLKHCPVVSKPYDAEQLRSALETAMGHGAQT